ncbi:MAG: helix-turn-helix transcriptional regulator [Anaerolineae bacterium]|uniref:winged helix-turn-helix transcriptional regulator n=1 Tax=Candidatus Flexifilum breve TaxID=3140694 RepID=UPI001AC4D299|nr:helix-turn-helix transcriptional regulator [Chloroflexota bacterium]MBK9748728.1 helix-turn-helix transcriptional regulator [Chloroflexota bacterium]MBN8634412.1 helix-turn-helix transcriptional regulator [Anaerolineae bacterium]
MGAKGCPIEKAVSILEGKWTLLILRELFTGMKRFGELRSELDGISPKTLTERLRILEAQGIVQRTIYPEVPPRVEYALTEYGETLRPVIDALRAWGEQIPEAVLATTST